VQVGPDLQVDDAVESAVIVLWIYWPAVIDHREKAVVFCHALKRDVVASIREMLRYRQAPGDVSESQVISN
jgi:hypothetical protein